MLRFVETAYNGDVYQNEVHTVFCAQSMGLYTLIVLYLKCIMYLRGIIPSYLPSFNVVEQ